MITTDQKSTNPRSIRTLWHRLLGTEFELLLTPLDLDVLTEIQVSSTPPLVDIVILRRHTPTWTSEQLKFLPSGIRDSNASHILIEFKMYETFEAKVVRQAAVYDYFYQEGQQLQDEEVATFIILAQTPQASTLAASGYHATEQPGIYRHDAMVESRLTLILLNELEPVLHNAFVQCFASQRQVRAKAFQMLKEVYDEKLTDDLWHFLLALQQTWQQKEGKMDLVNRTTTDEYIADEELTSEMLLEIGRGLAAKAVASMSPEQLVTVVPTTNLLYLVEHNESLRKQAILHIPKKERLEGLSPKERMEGLSAEERMEGLPAEKRLAGIKPGDIPAILAQLEQFLSQLKTATQQPPPTVQPVKTDEQQL